MYKEHLLTMSETDSKSIREEFKSMLVFLPEDLVREMNEEFAHLRHKFLTENQVELEQNRHFRRAVIKEGLKSYSLEQQIEDLLETDEEVDFEQ